MSDIAFRQYTPAYRSACLGLFSSNCPDYFAECERADYLAYIDGEPSGYEVCTASNRVVGAYGLFIDAPASRGQITWIMIDSQTRSAGIGTKMMRRALSVANERELAVIDIAASQKSAPFFALFGAQALKTTPEGWGPGLDRIDMQITL